MTLPDLTIRRVDLRVADVARAEEFYARLTGLEARDGALLDHEGRPLATFRSDGVRDEPSPVRAAGLFHVAFLYADRAQLGTVLERVLDLGIPMTGASDHGVSEALYFRDPDHNGIELYADRPPEEWPEAMFSDPLDLEGLVRAADGGDPRVKVGHVHLKASDLATSTRFWEDLGLELTAALLDQASFLAAGGYHHHVGLNVWQSRGAPPTPRDLPGLDTVVLSAPGRAPQALTDPEGHEIRFEA